MRDREAGLVMQRGEAGWRDGDGLHRGHGRVHNDALAAFSSGDWRTRHLIVRDLHVFSRRLMGLCKERVGCDDPDQQLFYPS